MAGLAGCSGEEASETAVRAIDNGAVVAQIGANSLLAEWTGPYGGTPAFDKMQLDDLLPAAKIGMAEAIVMRHRTPHFGHVFSGEGYSAGYYGYLWSDVLASDASEAFAEAPGGFYDKALARKLVSNLFSTRNAVDPMEAYRTFRGRNPNIEALMRERGFPVPE